MPRKEDFRQVISEWFLQELPEIFHRDILIPMNTGVIVSIVGPRRSGKTFLLYSVIEKLRESIPFRNILYVNFEHERLRNLDANDLSDMIAVFYEISNADLDEKIYFFLDEIHFNLSILFCLLREAPRF